jgi:hypothetical protein
LDRNFNTFDASPDNERNKLEGTDEVRFCVVPPFSLLTFGL